MQSNTHECYHLRVKVGKFYLVFGIERQRIQGCSVYAACGREEIRSEIQVWGKFTGAFFYGDCSGQASIWIWKVDCECV